MNFEVHATAELPFFIKALCASILNLKAENCMQIFLLVAKHENLLSVKILLRYHIYISVVNCKPIYKLNSYAL